MHSGTLAGIIAVACTPFTARRYILYTPVLHFATFGMFTTRSYDRSEHTECFHTKTSSSSSLSMDLQSAAVLVRRGVAGVTNRTTAAHNEGLMAVIRRRKACWGADQRTPSCTRITAFNQPAAPRVTLGMGRAIGHSR